MSKWIDADAFKRCLQNYRPYVDSGRFNAIQTEVNQVLDCIEYEIEDAPSIDIVRCAECKYEPICSHSVQHTTHEITSVTIGYKSVDFCSYGERKDQ